MMKISVIVPTYKPGEYLWDCLLSLKDQTLPKDEFEVLLVLNGCGEPYASQIGSFISDSLEGLNVRFIKIAEGGVSNARNVAIEAAEGEYIAFIDDDDYVSAPYLEELLGAASADTVALSYTIAFRDGEDDRPLPYRISSAYDTCTNLPECTVRQARKYFSGPCMKLIPRNIVGKRRFNPAFRNGEDSIFMFLISDRIGKVAFTTRNAVYYRRFREGSAVTSRRTFCQKLSNAMRKTGEYIRIYMSSPLKYDFRFFMTRVLGAFKEVLVNQ